MQLTINTILPEPIIDIKQILLADDDKDDHFLFNYALEALDIPAKLSWVKNGEDLMGLLNNTNHPLPDVLFLDLNMPRKNGFECLQEIKTNDRLKQLPVIICSTSIESGSVGLLYNAGAQFYIRKRSSLAKNKLDISLALKLSAELNGRQPSFAHFVLSK